MIPQQQMDFSVIFKSSELERTEFESKKLNSILLMEKLKKTR